VGTLCFNIFEVQQSDTNLQIIRSSTEVASGSQRGSSAWSFLTALLGETSGSKQFYFLTEIDNIAVGYLTGHIIGKRCIVTALYVEEKCRSLGIGARLLTCAQQFDANANETLVCVLPGQRELKNLCEQAGLPAQLIFAGTP
jgi:GNAT superfamily N-acetyltransferase